MSAASFGIGLLPGYATIGIWAPILLVALRLLQGFSVGGEYGGAGSFVAEYSPDERRGYMVSWLMFSTLIGFLMGSVGVTALAASLGIGLLPGYATIGIWAPILLVALRLLQGFSVGGEYGGAGSCVAEYSPDERRGYMVSWLMFSTLIGCLMGSVVVTALSALLSEDAMSTWGWRIPFLTAGPLGIVGLYIRLRLEETPEFRALESTGEVAQAPLKEAFVENWKIGRAHV